MDLFTALIVKISLFIALVSGSPITGVSDVSIATTTVPSSISAPVTVYPDVVIPITIPLEMTPVKKSIEIIPVGKITEGATSTVKEVPVLEEPKQEEIKEEINCLSTFKKHKDCPRIEYTGSASA